VMQYPLSSSSYHTWEGKSAVCPGMAFAYNMGVSDLHDTFTRSLKKPTDLPIMAANLHAWILATPQLVTFQGACVDPSNHIYTLVYMCNGNFESD
jgi:hypothetical protein